MVEHSFNTKTAHIYELETPWYGIGKLENNIWLGWAMLLSETCQVAWDQMNSE